MRVLLAGASGNIGNAVLKELLQQDVEVVALVRPQSSHRLPQHPRLSSIESADLRDQQWLSQVPVCDAVVSCIASRTGSPTDAKIVDYAANRALLEYALSVNASRFLLLSAICVQKPRLAFQREKLRFERELMASGIDYSIVRPTAFFKSLSGQIERVRRGKPFLLFGNGELTACKPISDRDLSAYLVAVLQEPASANRVLPIGGPGPAITPKQQAEMLARALGVSCQTRSVSPALFRLLHRLLAPLAWVSEWGRTQREFMAIAHYYATESMLLWDQATETYSDALTPEFGTDTLEAYYAAVVAGAKAASVDAGSRLFK